MNGAVLLAFARCAGFAMRAPGFGHPSVPSAVRACVALALALAIAPSVRNLRAPEGIAFLFSFVGEAVLGTAIGTFAALLYDGAYAGGRIVDDYTGVRAIAPNVTLVAPSGFGRVWSLAFTGGFFLFGAYQLVIVAFADSFSLVPPGVAVGHAALWAFAIALPSTIVLVALAVAGPAVALAFVVQIAVAAVTRIVPRLGSVTLASPLVFAAAILATAISLPSLELLAAYPPAHTWLARTSAR